MTTPNQAPDVRHEVYDPANDFHVACARYLRRAQLRTGDFKKMLALTPGKVAGHPLGVLALRDGVESPSKATICYNGVIQEYDEDGAQYVEVGGLYTLKEYRPLAPVFDLKEVLFELMRERYAGQTAIVFVNESSRDLNHLIGFEPTQNYPKSALDLCNDCTKVKVTREAGNVCCHSVVSMPVDQLPLDLSAQKAAYILEREARKAREAEAASAGKPISVALRTVVEYED